LTLSSKTRRGTSLRDSSEAELEPALYFVAEQPRKFLGDEFDVFFDRICGGLYEEHTSGEQTQGTLGCRRPMVYGPT